MAKAPPAGKAWLHEVKLDGYRFQILKDGRQVRLFGRSGSEWNKRLPGFAAAFLGLRCRSAVLDGELVFPNADGSPDFYGLRFATRERESMSSSSSPSIFSTSTVMVPISGHCP